MKLVSTHVSDQFNTKNEVYVQYVSPWSCHASRWISTALSSVSRSRNQVGVSLPVSQYVALYWTWMLDLCQITSQKRVCLYARTAGGWGGGRSPAGSSGGASLAPSEGHVTRQDKALSTWAETWLAKKLKGPAFLAWLFNALFHCFRLCFPAGLAQEGNFPPLHHCTLEHSEHFFLICSTTCLFLATNLWTAVFLHLRRRTGASSGCPGAGCSTSWLSWRGSIKDPQQIIRAAGVRLVSVETFVLQKHHFF